MKGLSGNGRNLTPRAGTRRRQALDAAAARIFKMPPGHHNYTLTKAVRVPMRDGVELLTDIYAPVGKSLGRLLIRSPYGRTGLIALLTARYYATQGYQVVNQSCRGTFGSGGDFEPFSHEVDDGADTVTWLRRQAWFGGRFALCGASYLGYTAWALMTDPPPELAAAVIAISAHDNHWVAHGTGAFALEQILGLMDGFGHLELVWSAAFCAALLPADASSLGSRSYPSSVPKKRSSSAAGCRTASGSRRWMLRTPCGDRCG
jgi:predicted acyl esterase